jgi:hypothetical protein
MRLTGSSATLSNWHTASTGVCSHSASSNWAAFFRFAPQG